MVAVPAGLPVGTIAGRFLFVSQDQADLDTREDYTVVTGTVKITCSAKRIQVSSQDLVVVPIEFMAEFSSDGYLRPVGAPADQVGVMVPASDSTVYNPSGFTWKLDFNLRNATTGNAIKIDSINMFVAADTINQVSDQMPISESKGVVITRGIRGVGLESVTEAEAGVLLFTFEDDTTHTVDINDAVLAAYQAADKPSGIGIDTDGTPYISPLANEAYIMYDTDGNPYFV